MKTKEERRSGNEQDRARAGVTLTKFGEFETTCPRSRLVVIRHAINCWPLSKPCLLLSRDKSPRAHFTSAVSCILALVHAEELYSVAPTVTPDDRLSEAEKKALREVGGEVVLQKGATTGPTDASLAASHALSQRSNPMNFGWQIIRIVYRFLFNYRPVLCSNCSRLVLVKNATPRKIPEGLSLPRWRLYCRKCAEFL
jgi:hypothetical protein